jgi:hypothetical protein
VISLVVYHAGLASALFLCALAFAIMQRSSGVVALESCPAALGLAIPLATRLHGLSSRVPAYSADGLLEVGIVAMSLTPILITLYRFARRARGGESIALIMSLAGMMALTTWGEVYCDGARPVDTRLSIPGLPTTVSYLVIASFSIAVSLIIALITARWQRQRSSALLHLAKDDYRYLQAFNSPSAIRHYSLAASFGLLFGGSLLFVGMQQLFSLGNQLDLVIPAFGVSLFSAGIKPIKLFFGCAAFEAISGYSAARDITILQPAYEAAVFCLLVLASAGGFELFKDRFWQLRRLANSRFFGSSLRIGSQS